MVTELPVLKDALSTFVANACAKLRAQGSHAAVIQVFLQTNRFRKNLPQYMPSLAVPLPHPTNNTLEVNRWADYLCERMFKEGYQYKKAGIMLSEISPVTHLQCDLLEASASKRQQPYAGAGPIDQTIRTRCFEGLDAGRICPVADSAGAKVSLLHDRWEELPLV